MSVSTFRNRATYEDSPEFTASAYRAAGWHKGIAWRVLGWKVDPVAPWYCCNCNRCGFERGGGGGRITDRGDPGCDHDIVQSDEPDYERTGELLCIMIGDDKPHSIDPDDLEPIDDDDYCPECGQIGCRACR